jgi:hypothetical protein
MHVHTIKVLSIAVVVSDYKSIEDVDEINSEDKPARH